MKVKAPYIVFIFLDTDQKVNNINLTKEILQQVNLMERVREIAHRMFHRKKNA